MIIIITGATHTGKTKLAQKLLEKLHFPYLSIDHIKMGLIRSKITDISVENDRALTPYLWNITSEIIKTAIENNQNLIVEGCYVPPNWKKDFSEDYLKEIKFICLCFSKEYIESNFEEIKKHSNDIEQRLYGDYLTKEYLIEENKYYQTSFDDITLITKNYEQVINKFLKKSKTFF